MSRHKNGISRSHRHFVLRCLTLVLTRFVSPLCLLLLFDFVWLWPHRRAQRPFHNLNLHIVLHHFWISLLRLELHLIQRDFQLLAHLFFLLLFYFRFQSFKQFFGLFCLNRLLLVHLDDPSLVLMFF